MYDCFLLVYLVSTLCYSYRIQFSKMYIYYCIIYNVYNCVHMYIQNLYIIALHIHNLYIFLCVCIYVHTHIYNIYIFVFSFMYTISSSSYFPSQCAFFCLNKFFSNSFCDGLCDTFSQLMYVYKCLFYFSFFRDSLADYRILGWQMSYLSTWGYFSIFIHQKSVFNLNFIIGSYSWEFSYLFLFLMFHILLLWVQIWSYFLYPDGYLIDFSISKFWSSLL